MKNVNTVPKDIREAELAMSNAYYNFNESNGNANQIHALHKIWAEASEKYRKFKTK